MTDNLNQLDQGSTAQWNRVYLGPTIGWVELPIQPELVETIVAPLIIPVYASRIILQANITDITLPNVRTWIESPYQRVRSAFDRSICIKDFGYNASVGNPIVLHPFAGQFIDGLSSYSITAAGALIQLFPLSNLTGWYVGPATFSSSSGTYLSMTNAGLTTAKPGSAVYAFSNDSFELGLANALATASVIGLVQSSTVSLAAGIVVFTGIMAQTTADWDAITSDVGGLTAGSSYFLDPTTAGNLTKTAPTTAGQLVVEIGKAVSATQMIVAPESPILL